MRRPTLIIMVKEPRAGRVKTRLGRQIGMTRAAWWYRHQLTRLLRHTEDPRWRTVLAVAPDTATRSRAFPPKPYRMPQGAGDLGDRMRRALKATRGPTVLIGSDIPAVTKRHIHTAFRALGTHASVIGPAPDGGFWLVGLAHPGRASQDLFQNVRWSHPETLKDTTPTMPHPLAITDTLKDVDDASDL